MNAIILNPIKHLQCLVLNLKMLQLSGEFKHFFAALDTRMLSNTLLKQAVERKTPIRELYKSDYRGLVGYL